MLKKLNSFKYTEDDLFVSLDMKYGHEQ